MHLAKIIRITSRAQAAEAQAAEAQAAEAQAAGAQAAKGQVAKTRKWSSCVYIHTHTYTRRHIHADIYT